MASSSDVTLTAPVIPTLCVAPVASVLPASAAAAPTAVPRASSTPESVSTAPAATDRSASVTSGRSTTDAHAGPDSIIGGATASVTTGAHERSDTPNRRLLYRGPLDSSCSSVRGSSRGAIAKRSSHLLDSDVFAVIKRHVDQLDEKFTSQITRVQQQSDRLREMAFSRVETKMSSIEVFQPKLERGLSELKGNYKGLSEEVQAQIRKIEEINTRMWECRHQWEDEDRIKFTEVDKIQQKLSSDLRMADAANDDTMKRINNRLSRLEKLFESRLAAQEETRRAVKAMQARMEGIEQAHMLHVRDMAIIAAHPAPDPTGPGRDLRSVDHRLSFESLEKACSEDSKKLDQLQRDTHDLHERLAAQGERLNSLRTMHETKDDHYRRLSDKVERVDWESKFKELHAQLHERDKQRLSDVERVGCIERSLEALGQQEVGYRGQNHEVSMIMGSNGPTFDVGVFGSPPSTFGSGGLAVLGGAGAGEADADVTLRGFDNGYMLTREDMETLQHEMGNWAERLQVVESHVDDFGREFRTLRNDMNLGPRIGALVQSLRDIGPKVVSHEASIGELHEKVGTLQATMQLQRRNCNADENR